jgi:predicted enzyme related to lactoylglutathione lyase
VWADDVDATAAKVKNLGGSVVAEPFDVPGVGRMAVCKDPTDAVFSLFHGTDHPGAPSLTGPGTFGWRELSTKNLDAAGKFYTSLFDWKTKVGTAPPGEYHEISLEGQKQFGGMRAMDSSWGDVPSHWGLYIEVADIDACTAKAQKLGGKLMMPIIDMPNVGRFTTIIDPTGAAVSVIQLSR